MDIERFEILARQRFWFCLQLMTGEKHKEYSRDKDKLHNFKVAGRILKSTPEKALFGMFVKHMVSVMDIVMDLDENKLPNMETIRDKIGDSINYMVLLEALLCERINPR